MITLLDRGEKTHVCELVTTAKFNIYDFIRDMNKAKSMGLFSEVKRVNKLDEEKELLPNELKNHAFEQAERFGIK
jgi:hypothetical protein